MNQFHVGLVAALAESGEAAPNFSVRRVPAGPKLANRFHSTSTPVISEISISPKSSVSATVQSFAV